MQKKTMIIGVISAGVILAGTSAGVLASVYSGSSDNTSSVISETEETEDTEMDGYDTGVVTDTTTPEIITDTTTETTSATSDAEITTEKTTATTEKATVKTTAAPTTPGSKIIDLNVTSEIDNFKMAITQATIDYQNNVVVLSMTHDPAINLNFSCKDSAGADLEVAYGADKVFVSKSASMSNYSTLYLTYNYDKKPYTITIQIPGI